MEPLHPAQRIFTSEHPVTKTLSVRFLGVENGVLSVSLIAPDSMVSDPESRTVHNGMATLILDSVMGGVVMGEMEQVQPIATTGLTVQHLRRAKAGEELLCRAKVEGMHVDIAHVSGLLLGIDGNECLSTATGSFMIGTRSKPLGDRV